MTTTVETQSANENMLYFALFYLLLVLSAYIDGLYNGVVVTPLIMAYLAILYYSLTYMQTDLNLAFRPETLDLLIIVLFVFEFDNILHYQNMLYNYLPSMARVAIYICLILFLVGVAGIFKSIRFVTRYNLYLCCALIFIINMIVICFAAKPVVDVYIHLKEAVEYFLRFKNPYANIYTQVYLPDQIKQFYYDDPLFLKYVPYQSVPPISLALFAVGQLLGDVRLTNAVLFCLGPVVLKKILPQILPELSDNTHKKIALVALLFPAQLHLIFLAWTDITIGFFLILFIYFFLNRRQTVAYLVLGIFLALKQYSVVYVVPFLFIMNLKDWKLYLITGGIILLPMAFYAAWNPKGFIDGIIIFELKQPFRPDSFSIAALLFNYLRIKTYIGVISLVVGIGSTVLAVYFSIKKRLLLDTERDKIKFMLYVMLFLFANFLMFSKQSFLNQYYLLALIFYLSLVFSIRPVQPLTDAMPSSSPV